MLFVKPASVRRLSKIRAALPLGDPGYARADDLVVSVGYPRDPRLCPLGAPAGETREMGTIPLAAVLARLSIAEAGSN